MRPSGGATPNDELPRSSVFFRKLSAWDSLNQPGCALKRPFEKGGVSIFGRIRSDTLIMLPRTRSALRALETKAHSPSRRLLDSVSRVGRAVSAAIVVHLSLIPGIAGQDGLQGAKVSIPFRDSLVLHSPLPPTPEQANRYVSPSGSDTNDGSKHHAWATISHAGAMASPGMIIHVAPGTYAEAVLTSASGSVSARIVYVSDQDWGAVILAPGRDGFVWNNTGNYSDVIGFEIGGGRCSGIGLGGSFQRAISNHVRNTAAGCTTSDGGSGINDYNYTTRGNDIVRNYVHDVGIGESLCGQVRHNYIQGIYQANAGGHIDGNIVANSCGFGIHLWHAATHANITNNTVVGNKAGGILIGSGDAPCSTIGCPGGNDYTVVRNNIVAFNGNAPSGGWGIAEREQEPGRIGIHNEYSHNLTFGNVSGDFSMPSPCKSCITGMDPRFISVLSGDYRLSSGSPAIGAGEMLELTGEEKTKTSKGAPSRMDMGALPIVHTSRP